MQKAPTIETRPRCAILTFHFVRNFGAMWQAYALKRFLELQGADVVFVDYRPRHIEEGGQCRFPKSRADHYANLVNLYLRVRRFQTKLFGSKFQAQAFEAFSQSHLTPVTRRYLNIEELVDAPPEADILICGSDQIWSTSKQFGLDPAYFLTFGTNGQRKVSYAASFGGSEPTAALRPDVASWLSSFDAISVREKSGAEIVRSITSNEPQVTPDPTLLLGGYEEFLTQESLNRSKLPEKPYVLSYALRHTKSVHQAAETIAKDKKIPHFALNSTRLSPFHPAGYLFPGPVEWLQLIKNAEYVVTNSFHGTVFSILCRKQFMSITVPPPKEKYNDRAVNLLTQLRLMDRHVSHVNDDLIAKADACIDWEISTNRLAAMRDLGRTYLRAAIGIR